MGTMSGYCKCGQLGCCDEGERAEATESDVETLTKALVRNEWHRKTAGDLAAVLLSSDWLAKDRAAQRAEGARAVLAAVEKAHAAWPVLVQSLPEFEGGLVGDLDSVTLRMSQRMAWLTEREYRNRFGDEPPTGPVLAAARAAAEQIGGEQ